MGVSDTGGRKTQALRAPGSGSLTPVQSLAASNPCLNCGTNVQLEYCPECGQRAVDVDPTVKELVHELAEHFLQWDGRLISTFRRLIFQPGELTNEYTAGRRQRFISPLRLYLTCSFIFFFLSAVLPKPTVPESAKGVTTRFGPVQIGSTDSAQDVADFEKKARESTGFKRVWMTHMARVFGQQQQVAQSLKDATPKTMFVLVPVFAAIVGLAYRSRRRRYPKHLAFALHLHAFFFLALSAMSSARLADTDLARGLMQVPIMVLFAVYMHQALRRVYSDTRAGAIGRSISIVTLYFALFLLTMIATFVLIVLVGY